MFPHPSLPRWQPRLPDSVGSPAQARGIRTIRCGTRPASESVMRVMTCKLLVAVLVAGCGMSEPSEDAELTDDGIADAKADAPIAGSTLSYAQSRRVLQAIDNACGDSWCEGEFNFAFRRITCKTGPSSCTLTMQVIDSSVQPERTFWRSCKSYGSASFAKLIDATGGYDVLTDAFYDRVNACMTKIEASIPAS